MNRLGVALLACALAFAAAVLVAGRWAPTPATGEAGGPNDHVPRDVGLSNRPGRTFPDLIGLAAPAALDRLAASALFGDVEYVAAEPGSVDARPGVVLAQAPPRGRSSPAARSSR